MSVLSFPSTGRTLTLINRTNGRIGVLGTMLGPYGTKVLSLRKVQGHPTYMSQLQALVHAGKLQVQLTSDILNEDDVKYLDAPLTGEIWLTRDVFTNPAAEDVNGIKTSFAAPAVATNYSGTALNGVVGAGELDYARNITITGTAGALEALTGKTMVITGVDMDGQALSESIAVTARAGGESGTDAGVHAFARVTNIYVPADISATPGSYEIGFGVKFGLSRPIVQGGLLKEFTDNAVPATAATLVLSPTALPNGTVTFFTAPNGTHDYVVFYIPG
jgi:hypothetical protein